LIDGENFIPKEGGNPNSNIILHTLITNNQFIHIVLSVPLFDDPLKEDLEPTDHPGAHSLLHTSVRHTIFSLLETKHMDSIRTIQTLTVDDAPLESACD
jgi:hypothetical protein